jgi:hypothetical protein
VKPVVYDHEDYRPAPALANVSRLAAALRSAGLLVGGPFRLEGGAFLLSALGSDFGDAAATCAADAIHVALTARVWGLPAKSLIEFDSPESAASFLVRVLVHGDVEESP